MVETLLDPQRSSGVPEDPSLAALSSPSGQRATALKVFVSSVFAGYEEHRGAVRRLAEALGHEPVLIEETSPALPYSAQRACLSAVEACDVMVLLLGAKYGTVQRSEMSATHEEWTHARDLGKEILALRERGKPASQRQADFIREVRDYEDGLSYKSFSTLAEMQEETVRALRRVESERRQASDFARHLPEPVRELLESMRTLFPDSLIRTQGVMRTAGLGSDVLVRLAKNPPTWATAPGPLVWEALSEFVDAACLAGGSQVRSLAIEAGSQRSGLYSALNAITAAEELEKEMRDPSGGRSDEEALKAIIAMIADDGPFHEGVAARVRRDPVEVLATLSSAAPYDTGDPGVAKLAAMLLAWVHCESERPEEALSVLTAASQHHPGQAWFLLQQARFALGLGLAPTPGESRQTGLLQQAHRQAIEARGQLRRLGGPSPRAVAVACQALVALHEPEQALRVGLPPPEGEATPAEATHREVQQFVADALLMTGRHDDIDRLDVASFEPWRQDMIHAMQANERDDRRAAIRLMRSALSRAPNDDARKYATFGLALFGEVAETADIPLTDAESALFVGVAALQHGNPDEAINALRNHRRASQMHADWLWRAQKAQGDTVAAIETLYDAVDHFGPDPLGADLVEMMAEDSRVQEAEAVAVDALARCSAPETKRRLKKALLRLAQEAQVWHKAYEHAAAMHTEDPQDYGAGWSAVFALYQDGRYDDARHYLRAHSLPPTTEDAARLATLLLGGPTAQQVDTAGLIELAEQFRDSEQVIGSILRVLMSGGERVTLTEDEAETTRELLEEFIEGFESSEMLWQVSAASLPELAERFRNMVRQRHNAINWQLVGDVLAGRAPQGFLWAPERPYATVLLAAADTGGFLTAVSADPGTLQREIATASDALGSTVVIDTSVAVVVSRTGISLDHLTGRFDRVLVPDQLLTDARRPTTEARMVGDARLSYAPSRDQIMVTEYSQEDKHRMVESAERVLSCLSDQQRIPSGGMRPEGYPPPSDLPHTQIWDAALRVAAVRGCALWCDDAAMRHLADTVGVATFGTYALYEALDGQPTRDSLPDSIDMRMRLLRANIADIPINLEEMIQATDDNGGPDTAWELWLARPASWQDPGIAFSHHVHRMRMLISGRLLRNVPELVSASCLGLGSAVDDSERASAMGAVLAGSLLELELAGPLLELEDAERAVALLVASARAASSHLDPRGHLDPLPAAAELLLRVHESATDASVAAQKLIHVFARLPSDDRRIVASVIPHAPRGGSGPTSTTTSPRTGKGQRRRTTPRRRARMPAGDDLAAALRARRRSLGLTQQALAERCGTKRPRVSNVESAVARPRISTVIALARAMRSSLSLVPSSGCPVNPRTGITTASGLGHAMRAARKQLQWRQQDLAERSGVHRSQISKIEAGGDAVTDTVLRLASAAGLTLRLDHDDNDAFLLEEVIEAHTGP